MRDTPTVYNKPADRLIAIVSDGPHPTKDTIELVMWDEMARSAKEMLCAGGCVAITNVYVAEFRKLPVLRCSPSSIIAPSFDARLADLPDNSTLLNDNPPTEALLFAVREGTAVVWPRCPTKACHNKSVCYTLDCIFAKFIQYSYTVHIPTNISYSLFQTSMHLCLTHNNRLKEHLKTRIFQQSSMSTILSITKLLHYYRV